MSETRNIVVLGSSFAGISISHYLAKHTLRQLKKAKDAKYQLHLVDPSTHFWWNIAAVRELVSVKEMPHSKCFIPTMDGFKQYYDLKEDIVFHHGSAANLDTESRTVKINRHDGGEETLSYYALGDYTISQKALEEMNSKLASAKEVVIVGGGPVGVETAGEIATHLKGAKITLLTSGDKLLPRLSTARATKAQKILEKHGVTVRHGVKATGSEQTVDGKTEVKLDNGETMTPDVYIPAVGVTPNTDFLPDNLRTKEGYVATNGQTLRVDAAGPRVYAAGDVSYVDKGGMVNLYNSIPVLGANITHDLFEEAKVGTVAEKRYQRNDGETQLVPIGAKTGVGAYNGWSMPGLAVSVVKGKQYFTNSIPDIHEGKKWVKA